VAPHFGAIIDDFCAPPSKPIPTRAPDHGGATQITRASSSAAALDEALRGPHDEDYFERRAPHRAIHVQINLPQMYMLTAMDRIRLRSADVLRDTGRRPRRCGKCSRPCTRSSTSARRHARDLPRRSADQNRTAELGDHRPVCGGDATARNPRVVESPRSRVAPGAAQVSDQASPTTLKITSESSAPVGPSTTS
jgi:hypothetical protein